MTKAKSKITELQDDKAHAQAKAEKSLANGKAATTATCEVSLPEPPAPILESASFDEQHGDNYWSDAGSSLLRCGLYVLRVGLHENI